MVQTQRRAGARGWLTTLNRGHKSAQAGGEGKVGREGTHPPGQRLVEDGPRPPSSSSSSLLPKSQLPRVCPNSSIPPSRPTSEVRREEDKEDPQRAVGGSRRPGVASPAPWGQPKGSWSQKWNNSGPSLAGASQSPSRAFLLSSSKFSAEADRARERRTRGSGSPGWPGRWDRVQPPGRTQHALAGSGHSLPPALPPQ